jgi:prepilin-type N-terminal cleavage/methylation domain-containing protein
MRKVKGFTLIECLIAMFILGISSLLLCQGYTQLMKITNRTNTVTTSIGRQMQNAESGAGAADTDKSIVLRANEKMDVKLMSEGFEFDANKNKVMTGNVTTKGYDSDNKYEGKLTVYEVYPFGSDNDGKGGNVYKTEGKKDGDDIRYIYFAK